MVVGIFMEVTEMAKQNWNVVFYDLDTGEKVQEITFKRLMSVMTVAVVGSMLVAYLLGYICF